MTNVFGYSSEQETNGNKDDLATLRKLSESDIEVNRETLRLLRLKLLDLTKRNSLVSFKMNRRSNKFIRIIDELPNELHKKIQNESILKLIGLPLPEEHPIDENNPEFISNLEQMRSDDETYKKKILELGSAEDGSSKEYLKIERDLKDLVREKLGMRKRKHPNIMSIHEYARSHNLEPEYDVPFQHEGEMDAKWQDDAIQTLLYEDDLEKLMSKIFRSFRESNNEKGINSLYFMYGFIEWYESESSDIALYAPLLIQNVEVKKERSKAGNWEFSIHSTGNDIEVNLTIKEKFKKDHGIELPIFDSTKSIEDYFELAKETIKARKSWKIKRFLNLGHLNYSNIVMYNDLDPDNWPDPEALLNDELLNEMLFGKEPNFSDSSGYLDDYEIDKPEINQIAPFLITEADSSQHSAIIDALEGKNVALQGPPGTGKSQTITNMIAALMAQGKRVLFLAEKNPALEVVYKRLEDLGLGKFCIRMHSNKGQKKEVINDLKKRINLTNVISNQSDIVSSYKQYTNTKSSLIEYKNLLSAKFGKTEATVQSLFWLQLYYQGKTKNISDKINSLRIVDAEKISIADLDYNVLELQNISKLVKTFQSKFKEIKNHPWYGSSNLSLSPFEKENIKLLIDKIFIDNYKDYIEDFAILNSNTLEKITSNHLSIFFNIIDKTLSSINENNFNFTTIKNLYGLKSSDLINLCYNYKNYLEVMECTIPAYEIIKIKKDLEKEYHFENHSQKKLNKIKIEFSKSNIFSSIFNWEYRDAVKDFKEINFSLKNLTKQEKIIELDKIIDLKKNIQNFNSLKINKTNLQIDSDASPFENVEFRLLNNKFHKEYLDSKNLPLDFRLNVKKLDPKKINLIKTEMDLVLEISEKINAKSCKEDNLNEIFNFDKFINLLINDEALEKINNINKLCDSFKRVLADSNAELVKMLNIIQANNKIFFDENSFIDKKRELSHLKINTLNKRILYLKDHLDELNDWTEYTSKVNGIDENKFSNLIPLVISNKDILDNISNSYKFIFYNTLLSEVYKKFPNLSNFSGSHIKELRRKFVELDSSIQKYHRLDLRSDLESQIPPIGKSTGLKKDLTEMGLINHLTKNENPRIPPLRDLIARSEGAIKTLKPCFMMSPTSLAQFIPPSKETPFDVLIVDEASQMRSEIGIGALLRAKQAIIVGDPKQLPPTSFFNKGIEDEENDEEMIGEYVEEKSILDLALTRFGTTRTLRWHYRSKHHSLIDFSNKEFYDDELIIFPSNHSSENLGVKINKVESIYKGKRNIKEAQELVEGVCDFMLQNPDKSCLVVAMNQQQSEIIDEMMDSKLNLNDKIADYYSNWRETLEPFEVKNLESVQGDERDCIFISTVFGPDENGNVRNTFGPINLPDGWRRLNVLITRAKERVELYTSLEPHKIKADIDSPRGRRVLKKYIKYAETGQLEQGVITGKSPDSEFEEVVMSWLERAGYESKPQVGVSKFNIDIGLIHPEKPDFFLLGIECDGAQYHSSKSARDRDKLREDILRGHGWDIYRIWSTDWFANPEKEFNKLDNYIRSMISK